MKHFIRCICVGLCERMSYGMYCTCIIGTRRSKSALPIKTCWILWIPNPVTLFCLSASPFFFLLLINQESEPVKYLHPATQTHTHTAFVWLQWRWLSSFIHHPAVYFLWVVRRSQSRHSVRGCHVKLLSSSVCRSGSVCVRVCFCVPGHPGSISDGSWRLVSCCRGKQERQSSGSALISPSQEGYHSPFLPPPHTAAATRTHKYSQLPQEATVSAADFHAFKFLLSPVRTQVCLWASKLGSVWARVCLSEEVITLITVHSANFMTESRLDPVKVTGL